MRTTIGTTLGACVLALASAPSTRAESAAWFAELPSVAQVNAAYPASTPPEYARRAAAGAVLADLVEVRSGVDQKLVGTALVERLNPDQRVRWREYVNIGYSKILTSGNGSWQMFTNPTFRADVLAHFLPKASIAAYEDARNLIPGVVGASNVKANWKPLSWPKEPPAVAEASPPPKPKPVVLPSGPLSVFSAVQLGAPLALPTCGASLAMKVGPGGAASMLMGAFVAPKVTATCVGDPDVLSDRVAGDLLHIPTGLPRGVVYRLVNLEPGRCPDWVEASGSCVLGVALQDGAVSAVGFYTGAQEKTVVKALAQKYDAGLPERSPTSCQTEAASKYGLVTRTGTKYLWKPRSLFVAYWSTGSGQSCDQGSVLVLTREFEEVIKRGEVRHEESQPKM